MVGRPLALLSALAITAAAQDYSLDNGRRRVGGFDEDALNYEYDYDNALPPGGVDPLPPPPPPPPRRRVVQSGGQKKQYLAPSQYGGGGLNKNPWKSAPAPIGKDGCKSGAQSVGHETACDLYYDCYEGQGFLKTCPNGLVFNMNANFGLIGKCDYPHNVDCGNRLERNPPQSTEHCDWLYGIFGHESSCTRYWTCWNGTATEQFCIGGLLYNEETHACDWPQNVAGCQKHPLCKEDANGNVPLGKSCNRYWACQGGYPRLQRCPAMLVFDKDRRRCVTPPTEDCEVPTTNAPPPEDEQGLSSGQRSSNPRRGGSSSARRGGNTARDPRPAKPIPVDRPDGGGERGEVRGDSLPFKLPPGVVPLNNQN